MNDDLLRSVRNEVRENVHFTPKETDIYKIHQSGDLANLDGLEDAALAKLPSLLKLRDALYSPAFRSYVATVTGAGALSGKKTDMAINVYTPGCHLLCHDDVIGSRRVSYILYLTDPDIPWKEEWGGALRLYPTSTFKGDDGKMTKSPSPDFTKVIPPAWNQLSFFAVQPGESFHDVEEVYHAASKELEAKDGGRIRMAISGWFHIPQEGEEGYIKGAEEKLAEKSSLVQLQGKADRYDFPQEQTTAVAAQDSGSEGLDESDFEFLLKYMAPHYLTPDTMEQVTEHFEEESSITLDGILSKKFSKRLRDYIEKEDATAPPAKKEDIEKGSWRVARPPHKHRFLYLQNSGAAPKKKSKKAASPELTPLQELVDVLLPSREFRQWLEMATGCRVESHDVLARRFRRGLDYALATSHEGNPRLEVSLGLTPTLGWGMDEEEEEAEEEVEQKKPAKSKRKTNGAGKPVAKAEVEETEDVEVGGHEVYMAGDDDDEANGDAAIYKASAENEDDNVLFTVPASWNKLSIVLRDNGVLKFVKYVSKAAKGDRWDVSCTYGIEDLNEDNDDEEEDGDEERSGEQVALEDSEEEEEFNGFPDSEDSDSE